METSARIVLDSIHDSHRVTTMEVVFHRFVLAELNTHRAFSRNSASSRAIPIERQLARAMDNPAFPVEWPCEQPGMQGGTALTGDDLAEAQALLENIAVYTTQALYAYLQSHPHKSTRLHKSLINRPLEWFSWHTALVTAVEWEGFFEQRCHAKAQPEFRVLAELMRDAYETSWPTEVNVDQWHTPLMQPSEAHWPAELVLPISAARCARVSYLTHDGVRDPLADLDLFYNRLMAGIDDPDDSPHWSPLEHVATPLPTFLPKGNLGAVYESLWAQLRHYDPLDVLTRGYKYTAALLDEVA